MKIAYFSDTFFPQINGVSNTLFYLKKYLDRNGIDYRFHIPDYDDEQIRSDCRMISSKGVALPIYSDCRLTLPWLPRLSGHMDAFQPDLIHLATEFGIGVMGRYYARSRGIPIVSSYHTNIDQYTEYYPALSPLKDNVEEYFKWFHRRSRRIFVPTNETRAHLQGMGYANLSIWSRGIDTELFSPERRSQAFRQAHGLEGKTVVLYVGRVAAEKDIDILPEIIRMVRSRRDDAAFVVTGDGPLLPQIRAEAPEGTIFTGFLRGEELAQAYASSDLFVTPSSTETFGNVALEAMASGLPVVAVDAGGFRNIISHGADGLLVAPRNAQRFSDALTMLIAQPETARAMAQRAVETAGKRSWDAIFERLIADYEQALCCKRAAS